MEARHVAPIAAVAALLLILAFAAYALRSVMNTPLTRVTASPPPGVSAPLESGNGAFAPRWTVSMGAVQDLALTRSAGGSAMELLALVQHTVTRFDLNGQTLGRFQAPAGTFRLIADEQGRFPFILASVIESHWSWQHLRRINTANHLVAIDSDGRVVWRYTLAGGPDTGYSSSAFDVLLAEDEHSREPRILVDVGPRIVCLDTSGRERWSIQDTFRSWSYGHAPTGPRRQIIVLRPDRRQLELATLGADGSVAPFASFEEGRSLNAWSVARMIAHADPLIGTFGLSPTANADGNVPERFQVRTLAGVPINAALLPWSTRPIPVRPLTTIDTDGDGTRAWIAAGSDGVLYLFSPDATRQETHHTGTYVRRLQVLPGADGGEWLAVGTERGVELLTRRDRTSSVD